MIQWQIKWNRKISRTFSRKLLWAPWGTSKLMWMTSGAGAIQYTQDIDTKITPRNKKRNRTVGLEIGLASQRLLRRCGTHQLCHAQDRNCELEHISLYNDDPTTWSTWVQLFWITKQWESPKHWIAKWRWDEMHRLTLWTWMGYGAPTSYVRNRFITW